MSWMEAERAYLMHLLVFSLPVLLALVVGSAVVFRGRFVRLLRVLLPPVAVMTAWLVVADHLAISAGIWRFGEGKLLGVQVGNVPVEEVLFFLITNALVAFGMALFANGRLKRRV